MTENNQLTIRFGGDGNIKVETLTNFLDQYKQILHLINQELGYNPDDLIVEVSPPENGSFKIKLKPKYKSLLLDKFGDLVSTSLAGLILLYVSTASQNETIEEIKTILESKKIVDEDTQKNIYNVYQNPVIIEKIEQTFVTVNNDENVTDLSIENKNEKLVDIEKTQFSRLINENKIVEKEEIPQSEILTKEAILIIKTVHFEGHAKWTFIFRGYQIKAAIKDEDFFEKLKTESFRKGDSLNVILSWTRNFDEDLQTHLVDKSSYIIEKVIEHKSVPKNNQNKLKLE